MMFIPVGFWDALCGLFRASRHDAFNELAQKYSELFERNEKLVVHLKQCRADYAHAEMTIARLQRGYGGVRTTVVMR